MNDYPRRGAGGIGNPVLRFLLLMLAAVIVLSIVVSVIKALWPWLLGIAIVVTTLVVLARLRGRNQTRW